MPDGLEHEQPQPFPDVSKQVKLFTAEAERFEQQREEVGKVIETTRTGLARIREPKSFIAKLTSALGMSTAGGHRAIVEESVEIDLENYMNQLLTEVATITDNQVRSSWMAGALSAIPVLVQINSISSVDDFLDLEGYGYPDIREVDKELLSDIIRDVVNISRNIPGREDMTRDEYESKVKEQLTRKPLRGVITGGLHQATSADYITHLRRDITVTPLPESMTAEDAINLYRTAGIPEDVTADLEDIDVQIREHGRGLTELLEYREDVLAGIQDIQITPVAGLDRIKRLFESPTIEALSAFQTIMRWTILPWAAFLYKGLSPITDFLPGFTRREDTTNAEGRNFDELLGEARETNNWWTAGGIAFEQAGMGWANRIVHEYILDPLNFIGFGILTKGAIITGKVLRIPAIGRFVGAFERGYVRMWDDLIFNRIMYGTDVFGKHIPGVWDIPKTPFMIATKVTGDDFKTIIKYISQSFKNQHYRRIPINDVKALLLDALDYAIRHPDDISLKAATSRAMLRSGGITDDEIRELLTTTGSKISLNAELAETVDDIYTRIVGVGTELSGMHKKPAVFLLMRTLGLDDTVTKNFTTTRKWLNSILTSRKASARSVITDGFEDKLSRTTPELVTNFFRRNHGVVFDGLRSQAAHNREFSGMIASNISKLTWNLMDFHREIIGRWLIAPFARTYLAFPMYGPGNIFEGFMKPLMNGQNPFWDFWSRTKLGKYNPGTRLHDTWAGVSKPMTIESSAVIVEMAGPQAPSMLDVMRGTKALHAWREAISGWYVGKVFIDAPAQLGTQQRLFAWHKLAKGRLAELSPEIMKEGATSINKWVDGVPQEWLKALHMNKAQLKNELLDRFIAGPAAIRRVSDDIADNMLGADFRKITEKLEMEDMTWKDFWSRTKQLGLSREEVHSSLGVKSVKADWTDQGKNLWEALRKLKGGVSSKVLENYSAASEVAEAVLSRPNLHRSIQEMYVQGAGDGSLFAGLGKGIDDKRLLAENLLYDIATHSPEFASTRYKSLADYILTQTPATELEFRQLLSDLENMQRFFGDTFSTSTKARWELDHQMATRLTPPQYIKWKDRDIADLHRTLNEYAETAGKAFDDVVEHVKELSKIKGKSVSAKSQGSLTNMLDIWAAEMKHTREFVNKRHAIETIEVRKIHAIKGVQEKRAAWAEFRNSQETAWNEEWSRKALELRSESYKHQARFESSLGYDRRVPKLSKVKGVLGRKDIAALFSGNPSDVAPSLVRAEFMALKQRKEFINEVRTKVDILASENNLKIDPKVNIADEYGYTQDALSELYDKLLLEMRMSPQAASIIEPQLQELQDLTSELWSIYSTKTLPKEIGGDLKAGLDDLADSVRGIEGYTISREVPKAIAVQPIADIPKGYRVEVGKIPIEPGMEDIVTGKAMVDWRRKVITVRDKGVLRDPEVMNHEIAHIRLEELADDVRQKVIAEFEQASKYEPIEIRSEFARREGFGQEYGKYLTNPSEVDPELAAIFEKYFPTIPKISEVEKLRAIEATDILSDSFQASRQTAADDASREYYQMFANYDNENILNALGKTIYPFFSYETHRLMWTPRQALRTPGAFVAWGRYMDVTEDGYVHLPGTSLELNPLRGSILMGGFVALMRKDYPEYYDRYPGIAEKMDYLSRFGFYPALWYNLAKVSLGTSGRGRPQWGELWPAWIKTPLNALTYLLPNSAAAKSIRDTILPEPYRDYMTSILANGIAQSRGLTFNGVNVLAKIDSNIKLDDEEQSLWDTAQRKMSELGLVLENSGMMKIRTDEQLQFWSDAQDVIHELIGVTPEQQLQIRMQGDRLRDHVTLTIMEEDILDMIEGAMFHKDLTLALRPSSIRIEETNRINFWSAIEELDDNLRTNGKVTPDGRELLSQVELNRMTKDGIINISQYLSRSSELRSYFNTAFNELADAPQYKDVAIYLEDTTNPKTGKVRKGLATVFEERGYPPPTSTPDREILNTYYNIKVESRIDDETGKYFDDWDTYFLKVDTLLNALSKANKEYMSQLITRKFDDLQLAYWQDSKQYFLGYNRVAVGIMRERFNPREQVLIRKFLSSSALERQAMREQVNEDDQKIIARWEQEKTNTRQNLRLMSPDLDARLLFWGKTQTVLTPEAEKIYIELREAFGFKTV